MSLPDNEVVDAEIVDDGPGADVVDPAVARPHEIEDAEVVDADSSPAESLTFPRLHARTQRFTLGEPRTVEVNATGTRILFLRTRNGQDPINCLWVVDATSGEERLLADPAMLIADDSTALPADELARRFSPIAGG